MKKILAKSVLITLMMASAAMAQTLEESLAIAYENSNVLKSKREELKAVDENIMIAFSGFLPTLQAGKSRQEQTVSNFTNWGTRPPSNFSQSTITTSLQLKQNLFNSGGGLAGLKKAKRQIEAQRAALVQYEQQVLLNVVKVYLNVVKAQMQFEIYEKKVTTLKKYLEAEEARYKAGEKTKTDVAQARSQFSNAVAYKIKSQGELAAARADFVAVVTVEPQNLTLPQANIVVPQNVDEAIESALKKNPEFLISERKYQAADNNIDVQRASLLPSGDLAYAWQDNSQNPTIDGTSSRVTTFSLTVPIFTSGSWSQLRNAKRVAQQYKYESLNSKQSVIDSAIVAWQDYETSKASIHAQEDAVESALIAYNGMKEEEKAGMRSTVDVIVAQNSYFDTDINLVTAKTNNIQTRYALKSAVGELTAKDLGLDVTLYDPLKNYNKIRWELIGSF